MSTSEIVSSAEERNRYASVVRLPAGWFIACASRTLGKKPHGTRLQGLPIVLFRDETGRAAALVDRCPHRNVPLSIGRVREGRLECAYHGWQFDRTGEVVKVPGLVGEAASKSRCADRLPVREVDGFIWVGASPEDEAREPFRFPHVDTPGYSSVRREFTVEATMHALIENTLDVPHTAFLHGGLFRTDKPRGEIEVIVRRASDRVEAEFVGEPRPEGIAGRILAPGGGVVTHFDRFLMPCIAQVEYRLGEKSHLIATTAFTPLSDFETHVFAVVTFRLPVPAWLVRPFVAPIATHIFRQDARMLTLQTKTLRQFGTERFASTEIDVIGPAALQLLRQAEKGLARSEEVREHRVKLRI